MQKKKKTTTQKTENSMIILKLNIIKQINGNL